MRASTARFVLLAAAPLALAGCYTVLSHPESDLAAEAPVDATGEGHALGATNDCLRCHVGDDASRLDAIGRTWNRLDRPGLDPRWPGAYANWLGYLPDPWFDYYRDRVWRDPWQVDPYDPWRRDPIGGGTVIVVPGDGGESGPPPETGTRHLWGRPGFAAGRPSEGGTGTIQVEATPAGTRPATNPPGTQEPPPPPRQQPSTPPPAPPREPEKERRHLWGRGPR